MTETIASEAALQTAFDMGRMSAKEIETDDGSRHIALPPNWKLAEVHPDNPRLDHIRQSVALYDEASFISYLKDYAGPSTRVFGAPGFMLSGHAPRIKAVIDYHGKDEPARGHHVAEFAPRYSDFWVRWIKKACAQPMSQAEFAELIEENRLDVASPAAARMIDIINNFKASKKVEFTSVIRQANGDVTLVNDEKTEQQGSSGPIPETMSLGIPVFFNGPRYEVPLWVRFRVGNGAVKFQIKAEMADRIEADAFNDIAKRITEQAGVAVYLGSV